MQSAQCHTPSHEAHLSYRCVWPWSQHRRSLSHTDPARFAVTVTRRHALSLRALTQPGIHCHTGTQPQTCAVIHRHTETYAFFCSLGWKGTPGATVSILLPLDTTTSLGPDRGGFFFFNKFIYLFLAVLGLCCCLRAFSSCGEQGLLFVVVCGLLIAVASPAAEHEL